MAQKAETTWKKKLFGNDFKTKIFGRYTPLFITGFFNYLEICYTFDLVL